MKRLLPLLLALAAAATAGILLLRGKDAPAADPREPVRLNDVLTNDRSDLPELAGMDHAIDSFMRFWSLQGASLSIVRNDSLVYAKGYGYADVARREPMRPGTLLRLASVSKLLTAVGIMRLQEDSLLNLQSPVFGPCGILDEYPLRDDNYCLITVEHLLRHQGGFSTRGGDPLFSTLSLMARWGLSSPPDQETLVRKLLRQPLAFVPGSGQQYSNLGYLLLAMIIEKCSGMPYEKYMRETILARAGCYDFHLAGNWESDRLTGETHYYMQPDSDPCPAYDGSGRMVEKCYGGNDIRTLSGAGAWAGSTAELARFVASIDARSEVPDILSAESVRQMTLRLDDETFALGWVDCTDEGEWTRTGSFSGTSALIKVYPDGEQWIFVTNTSAWRGARFTRNTAALFRDLRRRYSSRLPRRDLFY